MNMKIIFEKENPLFSRKEVKVEVVLSVTPSKVEMIKELSKKFKVEENCVRLRKIDSSFGRNLFVVTADLYKSKEAFNKIVKKTKQELKLEEEARKLMNSESETQ